MKSIIRLGSLLAAILLICGCLVYVPYDRSPYEPRYRPRSSELDISYFYDYLSPYGIWVYHPPYGYVWIPGGMSRGWRPYTYGRWIWTNYGWTWISSYEWGWIPFHYGRWGWSPELGWFWVPDTIWGPAWVIWRWGDFYLGWAPLPPRVPLVPGVGIISLPFELPGYYWIFIDGQYFMSPYLYRYVIPYERNITIINYTVIKTNIYVRNNVIINEGIDIDRIRRVTREEVVKYDIRDARRPGQAQFEREGVFLYKPNFIQKEGARPRSFLSSEEAREKIRQGEIPQAERRFRQLDEEKRLRETQNQERQILERTQEKDMSELRKKYEEDKNRAPDASKRKEIEKEQRQRTEELRKRHDEEKKELEQRQKQEEEQVQKKKKRKDVL